jgi:hypothetical protein
MKDKGESADWIGQYRQYMIAADFDSAIPLKEQYFPESFFRYRTLSDQTLQTLEKSYLWLSDIDKLNDPFEGSIVFNHDACLRHFYGSPEFRDDILARIGLTFTDQEIDSLVKAESPYQLYTSLCDKKGFPVGFTEEEHFERIKRRWIEIVKESNCIIRVCCFCLDNRSNVMWSNFGNDHKGICIEYDFRLAENIRAFIQPVHYTDEILQIGLLEEYDTMKVVGANLAKSTGYAHEKEWRLTIFRQDKNEFPQIISAPLPTAIYLGINFVINDNNLKKRLYDFAQANHIPLFQAKKVFGRLTIEFERLH